MADVVRFEVEYGDGTRNTGWAAAGIVLFVKQLALFPHYLIVGVMVNVAFVLAYVGYFIILFTGRQPAGFERFVASVLGWSSRVAAFFASSVDEYPPFEFESEGYPARFTFDPDESERSRGWALAGIFFVKLVAAVPHLLALAVVGFAAQIAAWFGFWAIVFTGVQPRGIHELVVGTIRWSNRIGAWIASLTDEYPRFSLR
jgi:hypothetical protein